MDDYSALAQRVAVTVGDVRGCLVLSRDGLVLGAFPEDESAIKPAWLKFATLGEPLKSFVEFGDQIWAYVHRGPYAAFIVAGTGVRPGVLIDQMEQALLTAEEARTRREPLKLPDATGAPSGKPRTSLHPPAERQQPAEVAAAPAPDPEAPPQDRGKWSRGPASAGEELEGEHTLNREDAWTEPEEPQTETAAPGDGMADLAAEASASSPPMASASADTTTETPSPATPPSALKREPQRMVGSAGAGDGDDSEIDRVLLAKEFSGLLQLDSDDDEDNS